MWEKKYGNYRMWQKYGHTDVGTVQCDDELSNVKKKKNNGPTKSEKSTIISNVGITQCDDGIVKTWRKKIIVPPNVTKV